VRPRRDRQQVFVDACEEDVVRPVPEQRSRDRPAEDRGEHEEDDEEAASCGNTIAPEAKPDLLPVATRLDRLGSVAESSARPDGADSRDACLRAEVTPVTCLRHCSECEATRIKRGGTPLSAN